jgi:hypothetical protein
MKYFYIFQFYMLFWVQGYIICNFFDFLELCLWFLQSADYWKSVKTNFRVVLDTWRNSIGQCLCLADQHWQPLDLTRIYGWDFFDREEKKKKNRGCGPAWCWGGGGVAATWRRMWRWWGSAWRRRIGCSRRRRSDGLRRPRCGGRGATRCGGSGGGGSVGRGSLERLRGAARGDAAAADSGEVFQRPGGAVRCGVRGKTERMGAALMRALGRGKVRLGLFSWLGRWVDPVGLPFF